MKTYTEEEIATRCKAEGLTEPSSGHDWIDELLGLLRVTRGQRDDAEQRANQLQKQIDKGRLPKDAGISFTYFVDGEQFQSRARKVTGQDILFRLPDTKRSYVLYLDGGIGPDIRVLEGETVVLDGQRKHFFTIPPATGG